LRGVWFHARIEPVENGTMMIQLQFPSPHIAEYYMKHAPPETVYEWLLATAGKPKRFSNSPFPKPLLEALLERAEPIIDLGIATTAGDSAVLRKLWGREDTALQAAIAANPHRDRSFKSTGPTEIMDAEAFVNFCRQGSEDVVWLWFQNPTMAEDRLTAVLAQKELYQQLSETEWIRVLWPAVRNPNLRTPLLNNRFSVDGYGEYMQRKPFEAAWELLFNLPVTVRNANLLHDCISEITEFNPPYERALTALGEKPLDPRERQKWSESFDRGRRLFVEAAVDRWRGENDVDGKGQDEKGHEHYSYELLRQAIAAKASPHQRLWEVTVDHPDVHVRRGFYQSCNPTSVEQLQAAYDRDGGHFLESAVDNTAMYEGDRFRKGIRVKFRDLVQDGGKLTFEKHQWLRAAWDGWAHRLAKQDPIRYPDPDMEWMDDLHHDGDAPLADQMKDLVSRLESTVRATRDNGDRDRLGELATQLASMQMLLASRLDEIVAQTQAAAPTKRRFF
jgi:hypothetical protein